jgi:flagellar M-ring protein FliF
VNFDSLIARLRTTFAALSGRQIATLAIAFVAVVSLTIGSAYWINTPTYGVLFSNLDAESASAVVAKLKSEKVAYLVDDGGTTVRVPMTRVDDLRLEFAGQGMQGSGRVGFELFDRTAFGATDFLEHVNYRRALEGELARTISSIAEVSSARVHIAMPQPSLFTDRDQPAKASVVLKLKNNRQLQPATVGAIAGLVSASVESLRPESVVIIDNFGRPLSQASQQSTDQADGIPLERQQRIERDYNTRLVAMLEPIVGAGRVRVNVTAKLTSGSEEQTEERWDPTPVVRSRQSVTQTSGPGSAGVVPQGVAGARSNLPPDPDKPQETAQVALASAPPSGSTHTAETTNYEIGKVTRHVQQPRGDIERLSVAVLVDNERATDDKGKVTTKSRGQPEIQKIHGLVAAAIGFDEERGDQLTVENIAFEETPVEELPEPTMWQQYSPQAFEGGRILGVVLIGLFAAWLLIRPLMRGAVGGAAQQVGTLPVPRTVQDLEAEMDAQLAAAGGGVKRMPVLTKRVTALTQREPENAARLLRTWLTEDDR